MRPLFWVAAVALPLAALVHDRDAAAYECTPVPRSNPPLTQAWTERCLAYYINPSEEIFASPERALVVSQSFERWSENNCTDISFVYFGHTDQRAGFNERRCDNQNVILAVEDRSELAEFFDSEDLLAITLTSFSRSTGEIFDADILFNAVTFTFDEVASVVQCTNGNRAFDIRNTLVHEMGHFIGFDHVNDPAATMFPSAVPCEIEKRDLAADDRSAVCETYSSGQPTRTCAPPSNGYDDGPGDPSMFRNQCVRAMLQDTECRTDGSCSCRSAPAQQGPDAPLAWLAVLSFLGFARRRLSGR